MLPCNGYRSLLLRFLDRTRQTGWGALVWFSVAASVSSFLYAQQADVLPSPPTSGEAVSENPHSTTSPPGAEGREGELNPALALQPAWLISTDSDGNLRQRLKLESNFALGNRARLGILFAQGLISNSSPGGHSEQIRDAAVTTQWHPNAALKIDAVLGVSHATATVDGDGQPVSGNLIPISKVMAHLTPAGKLFKLDLGFERSFYDLSPKLVVNRVIRNQFTVHPELAFADGWRLRELAEIGPMTRPGESNARYNSEFTVGHKLGKASELYSTYGLLHYAHSSNAGYFSPDLVHNLQGGWTSDIDRGAFSLSLDLGLGAGRSREHGTNFGPWGVSGHAGSYLTWTIRDQRELSASYEYYYDQSNPAVQLNPMEASSSAAWHMSVATLSFRWAR